MKIVLSSSADSFLSILTEHSASAELVLRGFRSPSDEEAPQIYSHYSSLVEELPTTLLVCSSGEADLMA